MQETDGRGGVGGEKSQSLQINVARQPIYDRTMQVYGYELLYRRNSRDNFFDSQLPDEASSRVILDAFQGIGIERMVGRRKAFINFTDKMLENEIATLFPPETLVVELLETVEPTPDIVEKCKTLKLQGYQVVLDDFVFSENYKPLIELADIIKIDFLSTPLRTIAKYLLMFKRPGLKFLAEKLETKREFDLAQSMGFSYFQGFFLSRPVIVQGQTLRPLQANYLRLLQMINRDDYDVDAVAEIIERDLSMSYDLLRMINSAAMGFRQKIRTIRHAIVAMGTIECRKWVSLVAMAGINSDQPTELVHISLIRARFAQLIAKLCKSRDGDMLFMMGLFSTMDAIMSMSFEEIFESLPASPEVRDVLTLGQGPYAQYHALMLAQEEGDWEKVAEIGLSMHISSEDISAAYLESLRWCIAIFDSGVKQSR